MLLSCLPGQLLLVVLATGYVSGCCTELEIKSSGFAGNHQASRMGIYDLKNGQSGGQNLYQQVNGNNYLFYLPDYGYWMVGPNPGKDYGGILNREQGVCPESITRDWEYYDDWMEEWDEDWSLTVKCTGAPGPDKTTTKNPINPEPCTWGNVCYSCNIWAEVNGVRYCCANDCNSGGIETWTENGAVNCYCYH